MSDIVSSSNDNFVIEGVLSKIQGAPELFSMARNLGLWSDEAHSKQITKPPFRSDLSKLAPSELSDLYGIWTYEFGRIVEICGVLTGQENLLKIQLKSALATARARIRRSQPDGAKPVTNALIVDLADEDPLVAKVYEQMAIITVMLSQAVASKEITSQFLATLSREISWRDAQIKAKIY